VQIGMIGLGGMGANMARRLIRKGHSLHGDDLNDGLQANGSSRAGRLGPSRPIRKESATLADKEENHVFRIDRYK
jgi:3-hydroxyisobutyrate dehydrogenase-like beta-hydroxyacid dehydrogenase